MRHLKQLPLPPTRRPFSTENRLVSGLLSLSISSSVSHRVIIPSKGYVTKKAVQPPYIDGYGSMDRPIETPLQHIWTLFSCNGGSLLHACRDAPGRACSALGFRRGGCF